MSSLPEGGGNAIFSLDYREYEVLNTLWAEKHPLTSNEIVDLLPNKTWKDSTIHLILNRLLVKGLIKETGTVRSGRTYARLFDVTVTMEEFLSDRLKQDTAYCCDKDTHLTGLLAALLNDPELDVSVLDKLENLIAARKSLNS